MKEFFLALIHGLDFGMFVLSIVVGSAIGYRLFPLIMRAIMEWLSKRDDDDDDDDDDWSGSVPQPA